MAEQAQFTAEDKQLMAEALRLGESHKGLTGDNPSVGAVLARRINGRMQIIGRGVTALGGRPHAEPQALAEAGPQAAGATLYVTLEPCCHFGQTPPCAEALIKAGIARAVIALADPDSRVAGGGMAMLRAAGIKVEQGCLAAEAARSLAPYLCRRRFGRPFITAKLAVSADGCIGRRGSRALITGGAAQRLTHYLRAAHDAVLIGIGTALNDNPRLDCRCLANGGAAVAQAEAAELLAKLVLPRRAGQAGAPLPARLVLDTHLRLPAASALAQSAGQQPLWLICGAAAPAAKRRQLAALGCHILPCPQDADGKIALLPMLQILRQKGINSIFVEGGGEVAAAFSRQNAIDQLILLRGPAIIGESGEKMPDFSGQTGYEKQASLAIGGDKAAAYLRLYGPHGLLGSAANAENKRTSPICLPEL